MTVPFEFDTGPNGNPSLQPAMAEPMATKPSSPAKAWEPAYDVKADNVEVVVYADLPGIDEDGIQIEVMPDVVVISGLRGFDHDQEDAEEFVSLGRRYGRFEAVIPMPTPVDPNAATAKYRRGVLRLRLPFATAPFRGRVVTP